MVRSLRKSLCSGFSTSTTPQGYRRPRIFFPFTSISWLEPITAKGMLAWNRNIWNSEILEVENGKHVCCVLLHQLRLSLSGPWSALWTLRPRPSRHRAAGRFWSRALQSHPGSDDGKNKDRMKWWGRWPDCDLLWHVLLDINSTLDYQHGFIPFNKPTMEKRPEVKTHLISQMKTLVVTNISFSERMQLQWPTSYSPWQMLIWCGPCQDA